MKHAASEFCTYPNCRCPFDAPADLNWCLRGLPKPPEHSVECSGTLPDAASGREAKADWMLAYEREFMRTTGGIARVERQSMGWFCVWAKGRASFGKYRRTAIEAMTERLKERPPCRPAPVDVTERSTE